MPDFENLFKQGIDAAVAVTNARNEIKELFDDLNQQLSKVSNDTAYLDIKSRQDFLQQQQGAIISLMGIAASLKIADTNQYKILVIRHKNYSEFRYREIARWKQDPNGYPCWIMADGQETACTDRQSLEDELATLASSPRVGEAILAAMNYITQTPPTNLTSDI